MAVTNDALGGFARAVDVWWIGGEHSQAGTGVGDDAGEGLVDFMGDGGGECAKAGDSRHTGEFGADFAKGFFRQPAVGYILNRADIFHAALLVLGSVANNVQVFHGTVWHEQSTFVIEIASACGQGYGLLHERHILGMNPVQDQLQCDFGGGIVFENAEGFFRPEVFIRGDAPAEAPSEAYFLGFGEVSLAAAQLFFGAFAFGDVTKVAGKGWGAVDGNASNRQFDGEFGAVSADGGHFHSLAKHAGFASSQVACEPLTMLLTEGGWDDDVGKAFGQDVVATMIEGAFSGGVELGDAAFVIDGDNAVERGVEDGGLAGFAAFEFDFLLTEVFLPRICDRRFPSASSRI